MTTIFATELNLPPLTIAAIVISGISFIVMFAIASAKGGYKELVETTLKNDADARDKIKKESNQ
tara:strand:- start:266 stop:457 length:192 start_codon:yes stop_codon:yes gene_type:complete